MGVVQPSLRDSVGFVRNPALKRWAGIVMSLRDAAARPFGVRWQAQRHTALSPGCRIFVARSESAVAAPLCRRSPYIRLAPAFGRLPTLRAFFSGRLSRRLFLNARQQ